MIIYLTDDQINICKNGNFKDILYLIEQGCDKYSILLYLCQHNHLEILKYLVKTYGLNINTYIIRCAICCGYLEMVKYLIEKCGADVKSNDDCVMWYACDAGHLQVVKYLIEDCGVDARSGDDYAIQWASEKGHVEVVKYLVEKCGAGVRSENDWAVRSASSKMVTSKWLSISSKSVELYFRRLILNMRDIFMSFKKGKRRGDVLWPKRFIFGGYRLVIIQTLFVVTGVCTKDIRNMLTY